MKTTSIAIAMFAILTSAAHAEINKDRPTTPPTPQTATIATADDLLICSCLLAGAPDFVVMAPGAVAWFHAQSDALLAAATQRTPERMIRFPALAAASSAAMLLITADQEGFEFATSKCIDIARSIQ